MNNKRVHERLELDSDVRSDNCRVIMPVDVSLGGIQVLLDLPMKTGDVIDMKFFLPMNPHGFDAKARVIWQKKVEKGFLTGFCFDRIKTVLVED